MSDLAARLPRATLHILAGAAPLVPHAEPYQPGRFYLRELPALRAVLGGLDQMALLIIDGFSDLDPHGQPGLGARARTSSASR
jgi:deoxyribonuclease V